MQQKITILGFAGSLRKNSFNKALLRTAAEIAPVNVEVRTFDLEGIPLFNEDLENEPGTRVKDFKTQIRQADAIVIATPEYNYSMSGVLKNAIDVASRPYGDNALEGKPVAIMGASIGALGTARAQYHLRQSCVFVDMYPLNRPEVMVPTVQDKVDESGRITDEKTRAKIKELLEALVAWTRQLKASF